MPGIILKLSQPIIKRNHPTLHLSRGSLGDIFELVDFLTLRILFLCHQLQFFVYAFFMLLEILSTLDDLLVQPRLEVVELLDLLLVDLHNRLHLLDLPLVLKLSILGHSEGFLYLLVLQLDVGGFCCILSL